MQPKTERLGQVYTKVMLCGQHIRLDYDKQERTITCQLKLMISIRLQLQVNTCDTLGAVLVCIIAVEHLIAMSSRWPRGPLVSQNKSRSIHQNIEWLLCDFNVTTHVLAYMHWDNLKSCTVLY